MKILGCDIVTLIWLCFIFGALFAGHELGYYHRKIDAENERQENDERERIRKSTRDNHKGIHG